MDGLHADGSKAQYVSVIGTFDTCDSGHAGRDFTAKGATYDSCVLALSSSSAPVTGAAYRAGSYSDLAPNTDYGDAPITWQ